MTELSNAIVESIENNPKKWTLEEYCLSYGRNRSVELWVSGGFSYLKIFRPHKIEFSFFEKIDVWNAFKRWKVNNKPEIQKENERQKNEIIEILKV